MTANQEQKTETKPQILGLEFCVNCPREGKRVPIEGNCFNFIEAGITACPNNGRYIPLDGVVKPVPLTFGQFVALPCKDGSSDMRMLYKAEPRCEYAHDVHQGIATLILRDVCCSYQNPAKKDGD